MLTPKEEPAARNPYLAPSLPKESTIPVRLTTDRPQRTVSPSINAKDQHPDRWRKTSPAVIAALLTPIVLLVHGYHPLADDGAVYVAGIKKLLDPSLYRPDAAFVLPHTRVSIFPHLVAALVRTTHLSLPAALLLCHLASIFLFLLASWSVAARVFSMPASRWCALFLAACCFTLPVAGTALFVMDPYVTARSFSTPFGLFALAATIGEAWVAAALWLLLMAAFHPMMAGFTAIFVLALALAQHGMWRSLCAFCGWGILACAVLFFFTRNVPLSLASSRAALSRSYFFLSTWEWYEISGLIFPLLLFSLAAWRTRGEGPAGKLSITAATLGSCALLAALCFVHHDGSLMLARLQVLRIFHLIYAVGVVLAGGLIGRLATQFGGRFGSELGVKRSGSIAALFLAIACAMFLGQRLTYPSSAHIEWPGRAARNPWQQAFLWIRANTPKNVIFAVDADYIESTGEDAQGLRATAERSSVADWYKDGGVASVFPAAQELWWREVQATGGLNRATDAERIARLRPFGVTWIVLTLQAETNFTCPYVNPAVKVCRLPGFS